jgi:uncharacterized membrane protein YciS (DUF1049 family)
MGIGRNSGWERKLVDRIKELQDELKTVFAGRGVKILDVLVPLVIFLAVNPFFGLVPALGASIGTAVIFFLIRIFKNENGYYALSGLLAVLFAAGFALLSNSEIGFFIPGLISGALTVILCFLSILVKRPLAALSSHITRSWPLDWYWHPRIRPAYSEVTLFWGVGFAIRLGLEYWLFTRGAANSLGLIRTLMGWPYTIILLIISYLFGIWRLGRLAGPSVEEFKAGNSEPWTGQKKGF